MLNRLNRKKIFIVGINRTIARIYLSLKNIWLRLFVGRNPPFEITVIERFNELNNLTSPKFNITKIYMVNNEKIKKICSKIFLVFDFEKDPIFPVYTKWFNL